MHSIIKTVLLLMGCIFASTALAEDSFTRMLVNDDCSSPEMIKLVKKAKAEINEILYLTIATVDENASPWNAPVYSAFDKQYHFYWMSSLTSQHSKNIHLNKKIFGVIYNSAVPEGTGFGVYLRGESRALESNDIDTINHGIEVMEARVHSSDRPPASNYLAPNPRRVYEFIPHQIWVNIVVNEGGKNIDKRQDITNCILKG